MLPIPGLDKVFPYSLRASSRVSSMRVFPLEDEAQELRAFAAPTAGFAYLEVCVAAG